MSLVEVAGLGFEYPDKRALDAVTFTLPAHAITALVGPNGAGKTTLLRCLAALERPLEGRIRVDGLDALADPRGVHARVGYLSDFFGLYDQLTVRQCLLFVARSYRVADPHAAVTRSARALRLEAYLETRAGALSRGWRQRLGIAQAIIHAPRLLLLDEPASGLDPEAREELAGLLRELRTAGLTIVVSSHILAELGAYSSHMLVIEDGRIVEFRAVGDDADASGVLLRIVLAAGDKRFAGLLAAQPEFVVSHCAADEALGRFRGDAAARARFLVTLVEAGLPVCRFEIVERDMQQVYLDILRGRAQHGGDAA